MRSLDSISFHSRWLGSVILIQIFCHFDRSAYTRFNLSSSWRVSHAALHQHRHPACRGVSSFSWRRLDEPCTLLSTKHRHLNKALLSLWENLTKAFDEESKHSRFFEGKASRISQKDGVFLSCHFDRSAYTRFNLSSSCLPWRIQL